jgi:predicted permease
VSAALLARSLVALNRVELGFDADRLVYARVAIPSEPYTGASEDALFQRLVDAVAGSPAVEAVAVTSNAPLTGDQANNPITPEGWQPGDGERSGGPGPAEGLAELAQRRHVSVNFFEVTRTPILDGRPFDATDDHRGALSVIISEGLARRMWPGQSAVGRRVRWYSGTGTVVGVAGNVRDENLESETESAFYVPFRQLGVQSGRLLIRTRGDPAAALGEIRTRLVAAAPPDVPVAALRPMTDLMADSIVQERFRTRLMVTFAGLAALFALLGIYGVTARAVAQRTRELAIRMALGAERRAVLMMIVRQGAGLALTGAVIGVGLALVAGRFVRELLYGVTVTDPLALGGIALLVASASVAAGLFPARRATRVDPMEAMRAE